MEDGHSTFSISRTSVIIPNSYVMVLYKSCHKLCQRRVRKGLKLLGCKRLHIHPTLRLADACCPKRKGFSPLCALAALPGVESVEHDRYYRAIK